MTHFLRFLLVCLLSATPAFAATFTVNDLGDASDANPGDGVCATSGAVCTLRAALEEANALAGTDTVHFSVAGTIAPATPLPSITGTLLVDGTTAPGYTNAPVVDVSGGGAVATGLAFAGGSDNSSLTALKLEGFTSAGVSVASASFVIQKCWLGPVGGGTANGDGLSLTGAADAALVGGNSAGLGNVMSGNTRYGINLTGTNHTVAGNYIGTDAAGSTALANGSDGIHVAGDTFNIHIGSSTAGAQNFVSGNGRDGIFVRDSSGSVAIAGNSIGVNAAGTAALPNGSDGVHLVNCQNDTIGAAGARNVISGNKAEGVLLEADCSGNTIVNNYIGVNAAGTAILGNNNGIVDFGTGNTIGSLSQGNVISGNSLDGISESSGASGAVIKGNIVGLDASGTSILGNGANGIELTSANGATIANNTISGNSGPGVNVLGATATGNSIVANSIVANGGLGIDLGGDGVTANDAGDADTGPNQLQNFPVISSAITTATQSTVQGSINTNPATAVTLHFYSNAAADPSGNGEGQTYLGTTSVTTDGSGNASFNFTGPATTVGQFVSATATTTDGTSEFSVDATVAAAPAIQFSSSTYSVNEGGGTVTITVTRSGDLTATSTVNYATSNGTATSPGDYTATSGTLTFAPGIASQTFSVAIVDDTLSEASEIVNLTLSSPTAATLGTPLAATLTIVDNDAPPSISITDVSQAEGNSGTTPFTFTVSLSGASGQTITVNYATANGTATAGSDYTATSGTLTFNPDVTTQTITVNVNGDTLNEPDETFFVNLTNATNATIADNQALGTIQNDDAVPSIAINDVSHAEGNAGVTPYTFTVTLSAASAQPVTVDYATANGTATAGSDYTAASGTLSFAPGVTTQTVTVNVNGDTTVEPDETFFVNLSNATNAAIADNQGLGTIVNDDAAVGPNIPTLSEWALIALAMALMAVAAMKLR